MTSLTPQYRRLIGFLALTVAMLGMSVTAHAQGQAGTTLTVAKTAEGFFERRLQYKWVLQKSVTPKLENLGVGATGQITYEIQTTRIPTQTDLFGVRGEICVTNGGDRPTEELSIVDVVQSKPQGPGQFENVIV